MLSYSACSSVLIVINNVFSSESESDIANFGTTYYFDLTNETDSQPD